MLKFVTMVCYARSSRVNGWGFLYGNSCNSRSTPLPIPVLEFEVKQFGIWDTSAEQAHKFWFLDL